MDSRGADGNVPENTPRRYTPDDPDAGAAARRTGEKVQQKSALTLSSVRALC